MSYTPIELASACNGELKGQKELNTSISRLITDSRSVPYGEDGIFVALTGENHDGHNYIDDAYQKGIRCFLVEKEQTQENLAETACFIEVSNTLEALQAIAGWHRSHFDIPVIAVTGSNGKTIVKEWLDHILGVRFNVVKSPKSYNSQVGVALSLWNIRSDHDIAIIEAGISQPGEMSRLETMIKPDIGVFTNIGEAHQKNFSSLEQKIGEKLELFKEVTELLYCRDHKEVYQQVSEKQEIGFFINNPRVFSWSREGGGDFEVSNVSVDKDGTTFTLTHNDEKSNWEIPFNDKASLENSLHCLAIAFRFGLSYREISRGLALLPKMQMRLEFKRGINQSTIINDSYNHDPESLRVGLEVLKSHTHHPHTALILSDMIEAGYDEEFLYQKVAEIVAAHKPELFIGIGPLLKKYRQYFSGACQFYETTTEFLENLDPQIFRDTCVLLKGARRFRFEKIDSRLRLEHHITRLEVNLDSLVDNLNFYKSQLSPPTQLMVMVKAFSYGTGAVDVAKLLEYHRADYLGVAYADEGIELRRNGIQLPIMVMNPYPASFDIIMDYDLEPEIYNFRMLSMASDLAEERNSQMSIHIKVDTGMSRLGFFNSEAEELGKKLSQNPGLRIKSVFSHLVAGEDEGEESFTRKQIQRYEDFCATLQNYGINGYLKHICNTAGIINYPESHYDMVRLGLGLYGIDTTEKARYNLANVLSFKTVVAQIKEISPDDTIGYNRKGRLPNGGKIATLMAGYADGIKMSLSNGNGAVVINGKKAPIVGKICMDMFMVDVTGIEVEEGDEAVIFGDNPDIKQVAYDAETIPYDILSGIPPRVKRVYYRG